MWITFSLRVVLLFFWYPADSIGLNEMFCMRKTTISVTTGHPDKVCDQIADGLLDEYLRRDPLARVTLRVLGSHGLFMIAGEVDSSADFDIASLTQKIYREIGYLDEVEVFVNVEKLVLSPAQKFLPRIPLTVTGYATSETRERLPSALVFAHAIARRLDDLRATDPAFAWLCPEGLVEVAYDRGHLVGVDVLTAHAEEIALKDVQSAIFERVVSPIIGSQQAPVTVNAFGPMVQGGFALCSGMSGQRPGVDLYGGLIPHADIAISGKDPYATERGGTYLARLAARTLVEQGLASNALVHVTYAPGRAEPVHIEALGTGEKSRGAKMDLSAIVKQSFDFRSEAIVERLSLAQPLYRTLAAYGHVGRFGCAWEEVK